MSVRSPLSLEKDRFNFAFNLANDLAEHLKIFGADYSQDVFNSIYQLQTRCYQRGVVTRQDIKDGIRLLGARKFRKLSFWAMIKAKLETDYVNSDATHSLQGKTGHSPKASLDAPAPEWGLCSASQDAGRC